MSDPTNEPINHLVNLCREWLNDEYSFDEWNFDEVKMVWKVCLVICKLGERWWGEGRRKQDARGQFAQQFKEAHPRRSVNPLLAQSAGVEAPTDEPVNHVINLCKRWAYER